MSKFRKRPIVIEARQWDGNVEGMMAWVADADHEARKRKGGDLHERQDHQVIHFSGVPPQMNLEIQTREGRMSAAPGDWIICGIDGEIYPCKPEIFDATYEPA
jgi:hypothetical protein